jgi:hypothetical protein
VCGLDCHAEKTCSPKTNGPLQVQTGRCWKSLARYRICP